MPLPSLLAVEGVTFSGVTFIRERAAGVFPLLLLVLALSAARAQAETALLTISPSAPHALGQPFRVAVSLTDLQEKPLADQVVVAYLAGEQVRRSRTDAAGHASLYLGRSLPVGRHQLTVTAEEGGRRTATAHTVIIVRSALLTVETVPPLADVAMSLGGRRYLTDEEGMIHAELSDLEARVLELLPLPETADAGGAVVSFERWADGVFSPQRTVQAAGDEHLYLGLSLSYPVRFGFVDLQGSPIDPARIASLTLKSSRGTRYTLEDERSRILKANSIARLRNGLEVTTIQYAVESVMIDGTNVVNRNQQRFTVTGEDDWQIELLLYSAQISVKDAIFGTSLGEGIMLEYPNGDTRTFPFEEGDEVYLAQLARGLYRVKAIGVHGMAPPTPVALSRDQVVELKVLSSLDIGIAVGLGVLLALGLLIYGRPQLFGFRRSRVLDSSTTPVGDPRKREV